MKICIAVNFLQELTGSEVLAIELANEFVNSGCTVNILAYKLNESFAAEHLDPRVNLHSDPETFDYIDIDIFYFQHQMGSILTPMLISVFEDSKIQKWPYLIFSHISVNAGIETPGPFSEHIFSDEIWCNSQETKTHLIESYGYRYTKATVFHNAAPLAYECADSISTDSDLTHILAVSNHFPDELLAAFKILEARGVDVSKRGKQFDPLRITPDELKKNQAVVTIGKTVQYAIRANQPVFCYDIHGGPGWLSADTFESASFHNFSGRSNSRTLTPLEIANELSTGFSAALEFSKSLDGEIVEKYKLERLVQKTLLNYEKREQTTAFSNKVGAFGKISEIKGQLKLESNLAEALLRYSTNRVNLLNHSNRLRDQRDRLKEQTGVLKSRIDHLKSLL